MSVKYMPLSNENEVVLQNKINLVEFVGSL